MKLFDYIEELMDGGVKGLYDEKTYFVHQIKDINELKEVTEGDERRAVVCDSGLYVMAVTNWQVFHWQLWKFLKSKGLVEGSGLNESDISYDHDIDKYMTLMIYDNDAWIGESYNSECVAQMKKKNTKIGKAYSKWKNKLSGMGITLMDDSL